MRDHPALIAAADNDEALACSIHAWKSRRDNAGISTWVGQQVGRKPDAVTCPDNLKGVAGATLRCQLPDGTDKYGVLVTVTDVDAGDVNFHFKVDERSQAAG